MERESKIFINNLISTIPTPWCSKLLVQDIFWLASHCTHIHFVHIWREVNVVAFAIAKTCHFVNVSVRESSLPISAANVFHLDQLGCGCVRGFIVVILLSSLEKKLVKHSSES